MEINISLNVEEIKGYIFDTKTYAFTPHGQYVNQYNWFSDVQKRDWTKACQHNMIYVTKTQV